MPTKQRCDVVKNDDSENAARVANGEQQLSSKEK
jgi:hypothetical protein